MATVALCCTAREAFGLSGLLASTHLAGILNGPGQRFRRLSAVIVLNAFSMCIVRARLHLSTISIGQHSIGLILIILDNCTINET